MLDIVLNVGPKGSPPIVRFDDHYILGTQRLVDGAINLCTGPLADGAINEAMNRFLVLFPLWVCCAFGQDRAEPVPEPKPVLNIWLNRNGFLASENFIYSEWFQVRPTKHPKWSLILPDVGFIAFDNIGHYREAFAGGGVEVLPTKALTIDEEAYFVQSSGPSSAGKFWYMPWTRVQYDFPKEWVTENVFFPYIALNGGATRFVWERSKLQYEGFKYFNFGAGYAAVADFGPPTWHNEPFSTLTFKTRHAGNFEVWVQKFPNHSVRLQFRHSFVWHTR